MKLFHEGGDLSVHAVAGSWNETVETTINEMGPHDALKIDTVHTQNWIDLADWLTTEYSIGDLENDVMMLYFSSLYHDLLWTQIFYLTGNYLEIYRSLRYNLEGISQAYHIRQQAGDQDLHLVDQLELLISEIEEEHLPIRDKVILPVLYDVLDDDEDEIDRWFLSEDGIGLWKKLCKSVHPSGIDIVQRIGRNPHMAYWNPFNEEEAEDALSAVDTVFDVIYVVMLKSYPEIQENAVESEEFPGSDELFYTNRCLRL